MHTVASINFKTSSSPTTSQVITG